MAGVSFKVVESLAHRKEPSIKEMIQNLDTDPENCRLTLARLLTGVLGSRIETMPEYTMMGILLRQIKAEGRLLSQMALADIRKGIMIILERARYGGIEIYQCIQTICNSLELEMVIVKIQSNS